MDTQKQENLLNLALDATREEREKSLNLNVGYNEAERTWDLIVKYTGNIGRIVSDSIRVVELLNEYAIVTLPESRIPLLSQLPEVEFIEKPKRLFFEAYEGRVASCMTAVQNAANDLFGRGILVAVLDSGIDYAHPDFRNADGTSRILKLWDQTIEGAPPAGYAIGTEYTKAQLDEALTYENRREQLQVVPSTDSSGHGTRVAGIAAGNGRAGGTRYRGVASESELLIVKLGTPVPGSFPRTTELMQGVNYVLEQAMEYGKPVAVNISFGNTYGSHTGASLLETYLDAMANRGRCVLCVGTGNEGAAAGHTSGNLEPGVPTAVELAVSAYEPALNVQIWKSYADVFEIRIRHPSGQAAGPLQEILGPQRFRLGNTELLIYYGEPSPYSVWQEIYLEFLPTGTYVDSGIWELELIPVRLVTGAYQLWLPTAGVLNRGTRFLYPSETRTLTIPSTSGKVISVGAYDSRNESLADFSGRGSESFPVLGKPDLAAPGVGILTTAPGGGYATATGTSFATPFVTGAAALLMQWGITEGKDPYLYGEKVKAYLQRGAKPLPGFAEYPNPQVGYGALCVRDSLPG